MGRLFANGYDLFMGPLEKRKFTQVRKELLEKAYGNVLEIGAGTGVNFRFYNHVERVVAIEPNPHMIENSKEKRNQSQTTIEIIQASAEDLPFSDQSFDTVVATLVFCTIPDPAKAMEELLRVCKPGGKILIFEHVKMENKFLGTLQEWLTPAWKKVCDGCCLNRNTLELIKSQNLTIEEIKNFYNGLFLTVEASMNNNVK